MERDRPADPWCAFALVDDDRVKLEARMDLLEELTEGLRRLLVIAGSSGAANVPEKELAATEKRLGTPLPRALRAFYEICGRHPTMQGVNVLGQAIVPPGELAVTKGEITFVHGPGERAYGVLVAPKDPGHAVVERTAAGERISPVSVEVTVMRAAASQLVGSMPVVRAGRSYLKPVGLEQIGPGRACFADVDRRVLLRREFGEILTVGAATADGIAEIEKRFRTKLAAVGADAGPALAKAGAKTAKKAGVRVKPADAARFTTAVTAVLRVRFGTAPKVPASSPAWRAKVEKRIGARLPDLLVTFHQLLAGDTQLLRIDRRLVPPAELTLDQGVLVLAAENQAVVRWGVRKSDLASLDPPVVQFGKSPKKAVPYAPRLSAFLVQTAAWQVVFGMPASAELPCSPGEEDEVARKLGKLLVQVGDGRFAIPTQETYIAEKGDVVAVLLRDPQAPRVYLAADQSELEALERKLGEPLEWL
jgi:hypothetical protein